MDNSKKLNAKDLINVGIYTAIYLVIYFTVGMLTAIPIVYPALFVILPICTGIPFMLFMTKVKKPWMIFIMSLIVGVFWFLLGYTWTAIISYSVCGLIAELIFKAAKYKNFKLLTLGYCVFVCGFHGCQAPMWLMADTYMANVRQMMGDQYTNQLMYYMPWWMGIVAFALSFIGATLGALLGKKMLKKHFNRVGIV